jgi:hypothetical protein
MRISGGLYDHALYAGTLSGDLKIAGTPDAPLRRLVVLFEDTALIPGYGGARHYVGLTLLGSTYSDPTTGAWRFPLLNPARTYTVIAWDSAGVYDPVIKAGLTPT